MVSGGQFAQITTADLDALRDAKIHPERHGDLIVRVGGFSIQFVQLTESVQDEIISRYQKEQQ
jgi:formate C-acetyltransferase